MARKKEPPKPLFSVKHDFYESLDEFVQQTVFLIQTLRTVLEHGSIPENQRKILQERLAAVENAMHREDGDAA